MSRRAIIITLLVILLGQFLWRLHFIDLPLDRDEGTYAYIAQRIVAGELPYRDVFDHKPPAVYYIYAGVVALGGNSLQAIRVFTAGYSLLTTLALFGVGLRLLGPGGALVAAALYAFFGAGPAVQGIAANTETFMVLPLVLALLAFLIAKERGRPGWYLLAGLLSGLAVMMKPVAGFNFLPLLLFALNLNALWLLLGFAVVPLLFTLYFTLQGALGPFLFCNLTVNKLYLASSPCPNFLLDPSFGLTVILKQARMDNGLLWAFALLALLLILLREKLPAWRLTALWTVFAFSGVAASSLFFPHYFIQLVPGLALLTAYAFLWLYRSRELLLKLLAGLLAVWLVAITLPYQVPFYLTTDPYRMVLTLYGNRTFGLSHWFALVLKERLAPGDTVFVFAAEPELYFYLGQKAPTKYPNYLGWMVPFVSTKTILGEVKPKRPRFVLLTDYAPRGCELAAWLRDDYNQKMSYCGWALYERKAR